MTPKIPVQIIAGLKEFLPPFDYDNIPDFSKFKGFKIRGGTNLRGKPQPIHFINHIL